LRDAGDVTAGYVGMGDRYGNKNGGIQSFLIHAVQYGARIFHKCHVTKICKTSTPAGHQRATGVECHIMCSDGICRPMVVHARRRVVIAAGALHSPCLLKKSGFRNYHIGKHLRLHPVAAAMGFYPFDEPIDSILGAPMTTVCNEFARGPSHNGYGAKIECPCSYPGLLAAGSSWISSQVCKQRLLQYRNAVPLIALQRDSGDGGSVKHSLDGKSLIVDYKINLNDVKSIVQSLQGAIRILVASGADEVATGHIRDNGYEVSGKRNPEETAFQDYLSSIATRGMKDHEIGFFSAHQMGTCRMSAFSQDGVVDPNGETWECDDLFVMDSSIFPTASGSNPMVTVLTIAHMLSARLCILLKLEEQFNTAACLRSGDVTNERKLYERRLDLRRNIVISACRGRLELILVLPMLAAILGSLLAYWKFI
jgi:GMC oxidoreductase